MYEDKKIFFSVVIPVYNKEPHIARSINSILDQTFTNFELIIVCDPSTDNSNVEVAKFTDPRIRVFHRDEPGPGGYAARNLGIKEAKADWIAFLDADDEWYPEHLQNMYELLKKYPQAGVAGCGCVALEPESNGKMVLDGMYLKNKGTGDKYLSFKEYLAGEIKGQRPLNGSTACIKKEIFNKAGGFPAGKANRGGDVETWLRCIEKAGGLAWGDYLGAVYFRDSVNMVTKTQMFLAEVERKTIKNFLKIYKGEEANLLKLFANNRTISAWRQNINLAGNNFFLPGKLYFTAGGKKALTWSLLSLLPKPIYLKISKEKIKCAVINLKQSPLGRMLKRIRDIKNRITTKPSYLGKQKDYKRIYLSDNNKPTFFGYHDKTPFSGDGSKILAMSIEADDRNASSECSYMSIGYFKVESNGIDNSFHKLVSTNTWCWQQGCMLQWGNNEPNKHLYFNKLVNGSYGSVLFSVESSQEIKEFNYPIYSISPDDRLAATLNFSRLGRLRPGYGYSLLEDDTKGIKAPEDDGLFLLDLNTGRRELIVSLHELAETAGDGDAEHYVNHATFSPDGKYLVFFHLWAQESDKGRGLRACLYDLINKRWEELEDDRKISHYCWKEGSKFLASNRAKDMNWHYTEYDLKNKSKIDLNLPFNQDGHPMYHPLDKNLIITDTYPDRRREQHLCIVNLGSKESTEIATLYSPFAYQGQVRCDLHPRWDRAGKLVVVDTTVRGKREMLVVVRNDS